MTANAGDAGDVGLIPGSGRFPGEGNDNPLQDSCLENPMNRGAWQATVHWIAKSQARLSDWAHTIEAVASASDNLPPSPHFFTSKAVCAPLGKQSDLSETGSPREKCSYHIKHTVSRDLNETIRVWWKHINEDLFRDVPLLWFTKEKVSVVNLVSREYIFAREAFCNAEETKKNWT